MGSTRDTEFYDHVLDLIQGFGPVSGRRMFGGYGLFSEGVMFGIIVDDVLYFKADEETVAEFESRGLGPFVYNRQGRDVALSYYEVPEEAMEDADEMTRWAGLACGAAGRAAARKK